MLGRHEPQERPMPNTEPFAAGGYRFIPFQFQDDKGDI
jgi:hypothetical protein